MIELGGEPSTVTAEALEKAEEGLTRLRFSGISNLMIGLDRLGETPLPPYIRRPSGVAESEDRARYQTVYARANGAVAAPTAGLHFTESLLGDIESAGVRVARVTLHVGPGTFLPVKTEMVEEHHLHAEAFVVDESTAALLEEVRSGVGRIIAVGTTTVRVLEHLAVDNATQLRPSRGRTNLYIYPPSQFRVVDALLTNFHLPQSTLLMLVSAFATPGQMRGREMILAAYREAVQEGYRFYSYGDAMLIL
jgi:S-adenosylmethionine:tRNA ribosyltransferase-isomerase